MFDNPIGSLYVFPITIPNNPLKWLNCYVIKPDDGGRCLLIDSGFNQPECREDLLNGISELDLRPENTDVFFTHLHSDHTGNAGMLKAMGFSLYMSGIDLELINNMNSAYFIEASSHMGFPSAEFGSMIKSQLAKDNTSLHIDASPVSEGQLFKYGEFEFTAILTPGHTSGHMCLYDEKYKVLICGDCVLFDISPNITSSINSDDPLGNYLATLNKIRYLDVEYTFTGHRSYGRLPFRDRVDALLSHHEKRLNETLSIVKQGNGMSAVDVASKMHWNLRANSWDAIANGQKWFAAGEAMAHLNHLCVLNEISSEDCDGITIFK